MSMTKEKQVTLLMGLKIKSNTQRYERELVTQLRLTLPIPWPVAHHAPLSMPSSRGSSRPRDQTLVSCISCTGKQILYHCTTTWEAQLYSFLRICECYYLSTGGYNKIPQTGWLKHHIYLTVLETRQSKIKVLAGLLIPS